MKPDIKWINKSTFRKTKNIYTWQEDNVYQAHTIETPGLNPYVNKDAYDYLIRAIEKIHETKDPDHATDVLKDLRLIK